MKSAEVLALVHQANSSSRPSRQPSNRDFEHVGFPEEAYEMLSAAGTRWTGAAESTTE